MTTDAAPAEALSREQLLTLLVQASEAAQNPGEEHEALAEQFMATMSAPGTANILRSILAALACAEAAEARVRELERDASFAAQAIIYAVQQHPQGKVMQDWSSWRVGYGRGGYRGNGRTDLQQLVSAVCQATDHADRYDPEALAGSPS